MNDFPYVPDFLSFTELRFAPDGLFEADVDALLAEVTSDLAEHPEPTTAVQDGTARAKRDRRIVQRQLGATVRVLRVYQPVTGQAGTEAA
ncbi:hypothetical protein M8C13_40340 [Crossiella sp. SN42]|uniref:hypothetical protein n=1 Tax=Crossiella sp. SN42 TaxID=2944808 RepID=UPI00207D5950|nr:hypothetical protein [Crossiella sp. SN42]MCO1582017.1 hypothetical protein [Crossiella sp. SN42]